MEFCESVSEQVSKREAEDMICIDLESKILEEVLYCKVHYKNSVAMGLEERYLQLTLQ